MPLKKIVRQKVAKKKIRRFGSLGWPRGKVVNVQFVPAKYHLFHKVCLKTDRSTPCLVVGVMNTRDVNEQPKYKLEYLSSDKKGLKTNWIQESNLVRYRRR